MKIKKGNLTSVIRNQFKNNQTITLQMLYHTVSQNPDLKWDKETLHHRVRSVIDRLLRTDEIVRVKPSTYRLVK